MNNSCFAIRTRTLKKKNTWNMYKTCNKKYFDSQINCLIDFYIYTKISVSNAINSKISVYGVFINAFILNLKYIFNNAKQYLDCILKYL